MASFCACPFRAGLVLQTFCREERPCYGRTAVSHSLCGRFRVRKRFAHSCHDRTSAVYCHVENGSMRAGVGNIIVQEEVGQEKACASACERTMQIATSEAHEMICRVSGMCSIETSRRKSSLCCRTQAQTVMSWRPCDSPAFRNMLARTVSRSWSSPWMGTFSSTPRLRNAGPAVADHATL